MYNVNSVLKNYKSTDDNMKLIPKNYSKSP